MDPLVLEWCSEQALLECFCIEELVGSLASSMSWQVP